MSKTNMSTILPALLFLITLKKTTGKIIKRGK